MTASLSVPRDSFPEDADGVVESAPNASGRIVALPPKPSVPADAAAAALEATDAAPKPPRTSAPRKAPAKRSTGTTAQRASTGSTKRPARTAAKRPAASDPIFDDAELSALDPGPPPPLPAEVAEPELVIPPKPELPAEVVDIAESVPPAPSKPKTKPRGKAKAKAKSVPVVEIEPATPDVPESDSDAPVEAAVNISAAEADLAVPAGFTPADVAVSEEAALPEELLLPEEAAVVVEPQSDENDAGGAPEDALAEVVTPEEEAEPAPPALVVRGISKSFGGTRAVDGIDLTVPAGTFYGLVGPNGAGKTTTLSIITGLLRPDRGVITINGVDAASDPRGAKRTMGVLPDRLRTFDRLTGRQLLYYYGVLRKLPSAVIESRTNDLARAFDLTDALGRVVSDYSAGMVKKVMLAGAMIHSPRVLVLDEPFESVDPVSSAIILDILGTYVSHGGTVILSSHGMELVERVCSRVAVIVAGQVLAEGTIEEVRGELTLEQRFIELAGGLSDVEGLEWLHTFSD